MFMLDLKRKLKVLDLIGFEAYIILFIALSQYELEEKRDGWRVLTSFSSHHRHIILSL